ARRSLAAERVRIGLVDPVIALVGDDVEFVQAARPRLRRAAFPDAGGVADMAHRVRAGIPAVEVAHHRDRPRVRRPHRETHAGARAALEVRAELLVEARVRALPEEVEVVAAHCRGAGDDGAHLTLWFSTRNRDRSTSENVTQSIYF